LKAKENRKKAIENENLSVADKEEVKKWGNYEQKLLWYIRNK
jgi:hypothetical protein